jgi:hypothetical protein
MPEWLTLADTTFLFHQLGEKHSRDAIKSLGDRGLLPCTRTAGGVRLFKREDVENFINERKSKTKATSNVAFAA